MRAADTDCFLFVPDGWAVAGHALLGSDLIVGRSSSAGTLEVDVVKSETFRAALTFLGR